MAKKLLGLMVGALLCVGAANASTFWEYCGGGSAASTGMGSTPTSSGSASCASFTVPAGQTLVSVELFLEGDYQSASPGGSTLTYTFTVTGGNAPGFSLTQLLDSAEGSGGSSTFVFIPTGTATCTNGQTYSGNPAAPYTGQADTTDCKDSNSGVPVIGPGTYSSITVSATGGWAPGSVGLLPAGGESFNISALFTYGTTQVTPEPTTLLMIGGGLIGLAIAGRRKFRA